MRCFADGIQQPWSLLFKTVWCLKVMPGMISNTWKWCPGLCLFHLIIQCKAWEDTCWVPVILAFMHVQAKENLCSLSLAGLLGVGRCQISLNISALPVLQIFYWHRWEPCLDLCCHVTIMSMKITATLFSWICFREGKENRRDSLASP